MPAPAKNRKLCSYTAFSPVETIDLKEFVRSESQVAALSIGFSGAQIFGYIRFKLDESIIRIVVAAKILIEKEAALGSISLERRIIYNLRIPAEPYIAGVAIFGKRDIDFN